MESPRHFEPRFFLYLSFSNFFTAVGGSAILTKGLSTLIKCSSFSGDSILAYLVGSSLSLGVIILVKPGMQTTGGWWCLGAALCALILWFILAFEGIALGYVPLLFFLLLCVHFALTFIPRALRAEAAAGYGQKIAWVELSYALGCTLGLLLWQRVEGWSLKEAVFFAIISYLIAATLDFLVTRKLSARHILDSGSENFIMTDITGKIKNPTFAIIALLVAMTVGVQIVTQIITKLLLNTDPLAAFDIGTAIAPVLCGIFLFQIVTPSSSDNLVYPLIRTAITWKNTISSIHLPILIAICYGTLSVGIVGKFYNNIHSIFFLSTIAIASLLYELLALTLLDHLGKTQKKGAVSLAFGLMAFAGTVSYWVFIHFGKSYEACLLIFAISILASAVALFWRHPLLNLNSDMLRPGSP